MRAAESSLARSLTHSLSDNTHTLLSPSSGACSRAQLRPRAIKLYVGKPIETDKMNYDDRDALTDSCKAAIADMKQVPP